IEPDLKTLLRSIRPRFKTAIATNRTDTMPHVIQNHGLGGLFDHVVTALDVARPKPDPEMLHNILVHFSIAPDRMIYVGDSELDEQAAQAAGVALVAFGNRKLSAAHHIDSMKELKQLLRNSGGYH
ncbi:MAG: HAD family hydrolase, partial [Deltaproteobacteria bacterium]|nr:HAD family hydrolase [Deltaproteobacteria bacterium]